MAEENNHHQVLVVGAGPAGLFASRKLAEEGTQVVLLNRDIKPGGLAEYGIYYEKYKIKEGLRNQFRQIMTMPEITYIGNVTVGNDGDITLDELRTFGFDAILVTVGAQGTKWLGLPGEELTGVYHAKDIVYHYNKLPPFSTRDFKVHGRVAMVGVGNVMMDIAHWAIRDLKVDEVIAVARRGPAEVKFTEKEMAYVISNLDIPALDAELSRCAPYIQEVGQDVQAAKDYLLSALTKAAPSTSDTHMHFDFLASPTRIIGNEQGQVVGLEVEDTRLVLRDNDTKAVGLGTRRVLDVDTVIFCIGDKVDNKFGLPIQWNEFVKNPHPSYPIDGLSYEAYDPEQNLPLEGVFVAGWSRQASSGLVGLARKDGENGVKAMLEYLKNQAGTKTNNTPIKYLEKRLLKNKNRLIQKEDLVQLDLYEQSQMQELGIKDFKLITNEEMLAVIV
jgi:ferredoxin--NADP+ reductase